MLACVRVHRGYPYAVAVAAAVLAVGIVLVVVRPELAAGCSCAGESHPRDSLAAADGAFVGELVGRRPVAPPRPGEPESQGDHVYTFRVTEAIKGPLGPTVDVVSGANGASCGIGPPPGQPTGLFLWRDGGVWRSDSCGGVVAPQELRRAAVPLPAARRGSGLVALLVGGAFRGGRLLALDRNGRTLGRGSGEGAITQLSVCPGSDTVAEVVRRRGGSSVALRDVRTLRVRREMRLPAPALGGLEVRAARCVAGDGRRVVVFAGGFVQDAKGRPRPRGRLLEVRSSRVRVAHRAAAAVAALGTRHAYLLRGRRDPQIARLDLATGRQRSLGRGSGLVDDLVLNPAGTRLAFHELRFSAKPEDSRTRLVTLSTRPGAPARRSRDVIAAPPTGPIVWLEDGRLASLLAYPDHPATVYDARLARRGSFTGWTASASASRDGRLYGVDRGYLLLAPLPGGPPTTIRRLPRPTVGPGEFAPVSVVAVPGSVRLAATRSASAPRTASGSALQMRPVGSRRPTAPWCRAGAPRAAS